MTDGQRYVLLYALGLNVHPKPLKNYFFAAEGDKYFDDCAALEGMAYLRRKQPGPKPPCVEFVATEKGVQSAVGLRVPRKAVVAWLETGRWPKKKRANTDG